MNSLKSNFLALLPLILVLVGTIIPTSAEPLRTSWFTEHTGQYARIYPTTADQNTNTSSTTWTHPNGGASQTSPTYAGVHEISSTSTTLYIRTTGLAFHTMGPWYGENGNLFPNYPNNIAQIASFPLTPQIASIPKSLTPGGAIGYFVDGVAMFDSRDGFSFRNGTGTDGSPQTAPERGDGVWNRDAYVNESPTFDPAFAHQAGPTHHYHANAPGLRHLLADSVLYDPISNTYTEAPSGKHSPILAWTFDGFPLYGPYGYSDPQDPTSSIKRMTSGYQKRDGTNTSTNLVTSGRTSLPTWITRNETNRNNPLTTTQYGPAVDSTAGGETFTLGHYLEDYAYKGDLGLTQGTDFDLNEYNVRFCITPEFPNGTWAYFTCIDVDGTPVFPYNISRYYYGTVQGTNNATLPSNREILFNGGPQTTSKALQPEIQNNVITLTWTGPEGGTYRIDQSTNLTDWETLNDSSTNNLGHKRTQEDNLTENKKFYRSTITALAPFDDNGFDYTPLTTVTTASTVTLYLQLDTVTGPTGVPQNATITPESVTVNGTTATYIARNNTAGEYNQFWIECTVPTSLTTPYATATVTFPPNPMTGETRTFTTMNIQQ